jgi:hypothetical protein
MLFSIKSADMCSKVVEKATGCIVQAFLRVAMAERASASSESRGMHLLRRMGLRPDANGMHGLGKEEGGPVEPIAVYMRTDRRGLGAETPSSLIHVENAPALLCERPDRNSSENSSEAKQRQRKHPRSERSETPAQRVEREREHARKRVRRMFSDNATDPECADISPLLKISGMSNSNPLRGVP